MNAIGYYLLVFVVRAFALLPLPVLYLFSDLIFLLAYHVFRYRRKVSHRNIFKAFPEKTNQERRLIEKQFYRHLGDLVVETVKLTHFNSREIRKHIRYRNPELLEELYKQGNQVIVTSAHYGNWEWLSLLSGNSPFRALSIYKPLNNLRFDRFMKEAREKLGVQMVSMRQTLPSLLQMKKDNIPVLACFITDQSPVWEETQYWAQFLNQDTAVYLGVEKMAVKLGSPVLFYRIIKISRGYYEVEIIPLVTDPAKTQPHEITDRYFQCLEQIIKQEPQYWLWSHNRWKLTERKYRMGRT